MELASLSFFNPFAETGVTENHLPHWQQEGAVYFLTFRLADALPKHLLDKWLAEREAWLADHPKPWKAELETEYHCRFSGAMERWLDAGHGSCSLRDAGCRSHVEEALSYFEGERCSQIAWVIMPNHVHVLFLLNGAWALEDMVHSWKLYSALKINKLLGKSGALWQKDYFDRLVRDREHFANCVRYIRRNPLKSKLRDGEYTLYESDMVRGIS